MLSVRMQREPSHRSGDRPPPLPPQPLNYGRGGGHVGRGAPSRHALFSLMRFFWTLGVLSVLLMIFVVVVPRFETIFADFGVKLPGVTRLVLDVGRFLQTPIGWIVGLMAVCGAAAIVALVPVSGRLVRPLMTVVLGLLVVGLGLAMLMPMLKLIESIAGGGKR